MGSLMAGWDSPVSDPTTAIRMRNKSLTKEEIEAYWRLKKKTEEEHLKAIFSPSESSNQLLEAASVLQNERFVRSNSLPTPNRKQEFLGMDTELDLENIIKKNGWWTRSNWAFLNEPPVIERSTNSYTAQFHVANKAGISA